MTFEEKLALACTLASGRLAGMGTVQVTEPDVAFIVKVCFKGLEVAERQLRPDPAAGAM